MCQWFGWLPWQVDELRDKHPQMYLDVLTVLTEQYNAEPTAKWFG